MEKKTIWDLNRPDIDHYRRSAKAPVAVVLDNVRSLNNIGSILRTCDGFGIAEVLLCGITATPPSAEIHKTALGAENSVDWRYFPTTLEAIGYLRGKGYNIMALEQVKGSISLPEYHPAPGQLTAIIAGNEVDGVDAEVVNACDGALEIPQYGTKHSLNVAVSTAIALYQLTMVK